MFEHCFSKCHATRIKRPEHERKKTFNYSKTREKLDLTATSFFIILKQISRTGIMKYSSSLVYVNKDKNSHKMPSDFLYFLPSCFFLKMHSVIIRELQKTDV